LDKATLTRSPGRQVVQSFRRDAAAGFLEAAGKFFIVKIDEAETTAAAIFHDNAHGAFAQHYGYSHEVTRK
jgi:hypothetical protein